MRNLLRRRPWAALVLVSALFTSACANSADEPNPDSEQPPAAPGESQATPSAEESATSSAYLEVPDGVELTEPGSELDFGEAAEVAWQPREDKIGALAITVLEVQEVTLRKFSAFRVDEAVRNSTPYFVRVQVANIGETTLGNADIPLYLLDGNDTLIQRSTFASRFRACPSESLPNRFAPGDRTRACLVYLAPDQGEIEAISFRPTEEFVPINWTGELSEPGR